MRCSKCGAENTDRAKFCESCASPFTRRCLSCGSENSPTAKFCIECSKPLKAETDSAPPAASRRPQDGGGERRHLTVLFSDLVNSTEIAAQLDPEEWRDLVARYQQVVAEAVARFEGHVAQYLGDGVLALYGYPAAHENEAERAVRTGLEIIDGVAALNAGRDAKALPALAARVGIHTGPVVVGDSDNKSANVFGDTPNMAARAQAAAEHNTVVVSDSVYQLISGWFDVEDLGAQTLKGIAHPVQLYRVIQPSAVRRRTHGAAARSLTPFVGRDDEMRLLLSRWYRTREREGQLALVVGEPGIGKSRLVEEFRERIKDDPHLWIECAGEQFFKSTPFYAVTRMLDQGLGWRGDESNEDRTGQLERSLELAGMKVGEALPLIAEMLNLPIPAKYPPLMFAPDQKRRRLLANLAMWVINAARLQPLIIAMEDLHWVDPSTLELQQTLVDQAATTRLMLLYTSRPEFRAPWPMRAHHAQITLSRLNDRHTREMVAGVAARAAIAKDVIDAVVQRTDGVPLFAEELTRLMLEEDGRSLGGEIPATLADSLMARLDRLEAAKEVAQIAAVIGREFSYEMLHAVSPIPEEKLQAELAKLGDAELIYARGIAPEATYRFKHALIRDAAYEALLKSRRRELHRLVACTISEKFAPVVDAQPEALAHHWTEAGEAELAIAAWRKAAVAAYARHAYGEAEESYKQALAILHAIPESAQRDARELDLMSPLAQVLQVTKGFNAPHAVEAVARSQTLAEKSGDLPQLLLQVYGTWGRALVGGDLRVALGLSDQLLDLARREGSPASLGFAHQAQLTSRSYCGDLAGSEEHFARGLEFFDTPGFRQTSGLHAYAFCHASFNAWYIGRADAARERCRLAIAAAGESSSPYDLAAAQYIAAMLNVWLREPAQAETFSAQALTLCDAHGFPYYAADSRTILGWARACLGRASEGVTLIRQGLAVLAETRSRLAITMLLVCLSEAQALDGATADALVTIDEALVANPEELCYRPAAFRVRGELRLKNGKDELAEADFREAIALAQKIGAKAWELRATTSLARLLAKQGKRAEARAMLADIYSWFTEGFDTADLKDAKALLDQLSN